MGVPTLSAAYKRGKISPVVARMSLLETEALTKRGMFPSPFGSSVVSPRAQRGREVIITVTAYVMLMRLQVMVHASSNSTKLRRAPLLVTLPLAET